MKISIDVEQAVSWLKTIGGEIPSILGMAEAQGLAIPPTIAKVAPWIGMAGETLGRLAPKLSRDGLSAPGIDTGPLGRGRLTYLLEREKWKDEEVAYAFSCVLDPSAGLPSAREAEQAVMFALRCLTPGGDWTSSHKREALEHVLRIEGSLPDTQRDKLGDLIYYVLRQGLTQPDKG